VASRIENQRPKVRVLAGDFVKVGMFLRTTRSTVAFFPISFPRSLFNVSYVLALHPKEEVIAPELVVEEIESSVVTARRGPGKMIFESEKQTRGADS
jgi:hypothetical protein